MKIIPDRIQNINKESAKTVMDISQSDFTEQKPAAPQYCQSFGFKQGTPPVAEAYFRAAMSLPTIPGTASQKEYSPVDELNGAPK